MELFFIFMLFIMGTVFGSFFTLAVYRIPLGLDITHERSFCPNCNHRLEFWDLIPVFSYIFLGGKCRYCGKPVRIRYLLLEVTSGCVFVVAYFVMHLNFPFFEVSDIAKMISFVMFYITNAIILGIDKEYININKKVLLFGFITQIIYILYLYAFESINMYRYGIYLILIIFLVIFDKILLKKYSKNYYLIQIFMLLIYELFVINNIRIFIIAICGSGVIYFIYKLIKKNKIPIGFCISLSSVIAVLVGNLF